ncbi:MAG: hypothetical protein IJ574_04135 [Bacilli bacterium]|nr:hypothetical protein [Bacilli bacterium]
MMNTLNKLKVNYVTYAMFLLALLSGYFKNISVIFSIIIIHEFGHVFFIKLFNYNIEKIEIFPFGGITRVNKPINSSINKELIIANGGILFQLLLGIVINVFLYNDTYLYKIFNEYNKYIILFNLIPIIPLDGYKIFNLLLEKVLSYKKAYRVSQLISIICLIIFVIFNIKYKINNYVMISLLIYKVIDSFKLFPYYYNMFLLERHLYQFPYKEIIYNNRKDLSLLKKEKYHFFKRNGLIYSEKTLLNNKFCNK